VATAETTILTENEQLAGINADYEQRYGFHDAENYLYKAWVRSSKMAGWPDDRDPHFNGEVAVHVLPFAEAAQAFGSRRGRVGRIRFMGFTVLNTRCRQNGLWRHSDGSGSERSVATLAAVRLRAPAATGRTEPLRSVKNPCTVEPASLVSGTKVLPAAHPEG
jgi:hypothetical protein